MFVPQPPGKSIVSTVDQLLVVGIICLAAFIQGLTGFGYGMAAMALLPLLMDFREATLLVAVLGLAVNVFTFVGYRTEYRWHEGRSLIFGAVLGAPIGVALVHWVDASIMIRALGGLICVFTFNELIVSRHSKWKIPESWGFPLGCLAGLFGSAFNIGGPPAVMYAYSQPWSKQQVVACLQVLFLVIGTLRVVLSAAAGRLETHHLGLAFAVMLPMFACIWAGRQLLERIPQGRLRMVVYVGLFAMGVKYVIGG